MCLGAIGKKECKVKMIGIYLLIVLEGDISQEAISAFLAIGDYNI